MFVFNPCSVQALNLDLGDDTYDILLKFEAMGIIQSGLLGTRPLSWKETIRLALEAERNVKDKSPFLKLLVLRLKKRLDIESREVNFIKPIDEFYSGFVSSDQEGLAFNNRIAFNNEGDIYSQGENFRLGFASKAELGRFSFYLNPEFRFTDKEQEAVLKKAYLTFDFWGLKLEAGKDSQWWGPGHHGALLFSNNAESLTLIKLTNPHPVLLPWVFRGLGPFRFVLFASRLDEERVVPEPYIWGLRLNFKPTPYFEIGFNRTVLLGGAGQPENLEAWWESVVSVKSSRSDQRAGGDIKITLPFSVQPFQLYIEVASEGGAEGILENSAYLAGIYFPQILSIESLSFRVEYANTGLDRNIDWYSDNIYESGYTYKGRIMGHHAGAGSDNLFLELGYLLPEWEAMFKLSYERKRQYLSESQKSVQGVLSSAVSFKATDNLRLEGRLSHGKFNDIIAEAFSLFAMKLIYRF